MVNSMRTVRCIKVQRETERSRSIICYVYILRIIVLVIEVYLYTINVYDNRFIKLLHELLYHLNNVNIIFV
jgi:hypothetical protein